MIHSRWKAFDGAPVITLILACVEARLEANVLPMGCLLPNAFLSLCDMVLGLEKSNDFAWKRIERISLFFCLTCNAEVLVRDLDFVYIL